MKWFQVCALLMVVCFPAVTGFSGEDYMNNNLDTDLLTNSGGEVEDHPLTLGSNTTVELSEQGVVPLVQPAQLDSAELAAQMNSADLAGPATDTLASHVPHTHDTHTHDTHTHDTHATGDKANTSASDKPVNGDSNDISKNTLMDADGGLDEAPSDGKPKQALLGGGSPALDQMCLGRVVDKAYRPLDEWYDDSCHKYRCEIVNKAYHIKVYGCEKPQPPENAIECREYQLHDGKNLKYPGCCPRLRCIVSYRGKKFIQIVGQLDEPDAQDMTTAESTTHSEETDVTTLSTVSVTRPPHPDQSTTAETQIQIIKRAEEEFVRTLGFNGARVAPEDEYEHLAPRRPQADDDYDSKRLMSQVSDQMCIGVERRRRKRYTPLRVWYDDACHKYRCEVLNGKYHIAVIGCIKPEAPINAIQCNEYNLDNENVMYPVCCPRLRCVVVIKGEMYVRISGQPEEEFPDVPLRTNQPGSLLNLTRNMYAPAEAPHTSAPVTYYYPKQAAEVYNDPMETAARARPEPPIPMLNVHMDWKHNILTEYIHRGVIKALQYLKESLK